MDEVFDQRELLSRDALRTLQIRKNGPSYARLLIHFVTIFLLGYMVTACASSPLLALIFSLMLACVWATIFAPFHESTHRTAFSSRQENSWAAAITAIPFAMSPGFYRAFHFEHHRHTQDPERDPEIQGNPDLFSPWPKSRYGWLILASGYGLIMLKAVPLVRLSLLATDKWDRIAPWIPGPSERGRVVLENRVILGSWLLFLVCAATVIEGGWWLIFAAWLAHVVQALWISAEHTGLPLEGTILQRTRTVRTSPIVSWWVWNMNYHAEHHAWPGVPWHQLPAVHEQVQAALDHNVESYVGLHRDVLTAMTK